MTTAIEVRDLRFSYPGGGEALRGVTLSIAQGECVGLVGPNGAGKSTLLLHMNGLLPEAGPDGASVHLFGQPLTKDSLREARRKVGLLFQDPNDQLFCPTVFEDVAFGPRQLFPAQDGVEERVRRCLEKVGLQGFGEREPHRLSGGEKRRVCIAGVLACEPEVLVLDEPTSDLDPRGRRELKALLQSIHLTKLIASHDLDLVAEICTRVIVMDEGKVVADGPARRVLADEQLMLAHGLERPRVMLESEGNPLPGAV